MVKHSFSYFLHSFLNTAPFNHIPDGAQHSNSLSFWPKYWEQQRILQLKKCSFFSVYVIEKFLLFDRRIQKVWQCICLFWDGAWQDLLSLLFWHLLIRRLELLEFYDRRTQKSFRQSTQSHLPVFARRHIFVHFGQCLLSRSSHTYWNDGFKRHCSGKL